MSKTKIPSIDTIRRNNIDAGQHFFDLATMRARGEKTNHWKPVKFEQRLFIVNHMNYDAPVYEVFKDGADIRYVNCPLTTNIIKDAVHG